MIGKKTRKAQDCTCTVTPSICNVKVVLSSPMVFTWSVVVNWSSRRRRKREDFPTDTLPTMASLNVGTDSRVVALDIYAPHTSTEAPPSSTDAPPTSTKFLPHPLTLLPQPPRLAGGTMGKFIWLTMNSAIYSYIPIHTGRLHTGSYWYTLIHTGTH